MTFKMTVRPLIALTIVLLCVSCESGDGDADPREVAQVTTTESATDISSAAALPSPDIVLDGTDVFELASFDLRPLDDSAAGQYGVEQGGAELSVTLSAAGTDWQLERTYQEPGEPLDQVVYDLKLSGGMLMSSDGKAMVRGTDEGILVLERKSETIPADYWVHYLRQNRH